MTTFAPAAALRTTAARPNVRGWALAAAVYFLAVFHRSSLGVAGLLAEDRFGISAAQLGAFVLLQIGVYAAMQIPTGVLVDRYGPRRLLVAAAAFMALGQLLFAVAPSYPLALLARGLLGCGDAMTFVSVLRYAAQRFSPRRYPLLVALTSTIGMAGNMLATLPLEQLLQRLGWAASFAGAGTLSVLSGIAVWALLDDRAPRPSPVRGAPAVRAGIIAVSRRVATAWTMPGTRLGFWVHFASMSTATAFALLWGQPYLVKGAGFTSSAASSILLLGVIVAGGGGMLVGWFIGRRPSLRIGLALVVCAVTIIGWTLVVFTLGDHPSHVVVATLFAITMMGGPASMVAFAVARDYNDPRVFGTATGAVNVGGFVATAVVAILFGEVVTWLGGTSPDHLRYALLVPVAVQLYGSTRIVVWLRRVRALVASRQRSGAEVPVAVNRRYFWDARWDADEKSLAR